MLANSFLLWFAHASFLSHKSCTCRIVDCGLSLVVIMTANGKPDRVLSGSQATGLYLLCLFYLYFCNNTRTFKRPLLFCHCCRTQKNSIILKQRLTSFWVILKKHSPQLFHLAAVVHRSSPELCDITIGIASGQPTTFPTHLIMRLNGDMRQSLAKNKWYVFFFKERIPPVDQTSLVATKCLWSVSMPTVCGFRWFCATFAYLWHQILL